MQQPPKRLRSQELYERARQLIPGGVNSPVRAFRAVGATPLIVARARGSQITDVDGNHYIDYIGAWGPLLLGHAHPDVEHAVAQALERGTAFGLTTEAEVRLAQLITEAIPSIEKVRLVNSGTEATMSAIRLARGFTKRDSIVKFIGCYHGHVDSLLVKAGSGVATFALPESAGVPAQFAELTLAVPFNHPEALEKVFAAHRSKIAAVILEPVVGNMGCVPPAEGFLNTVRELTERDGALLIFDEVMTGFRLAYGGAQALYGIRPDLTTLGKVIGGGLPVGAYGGRKDIMDCVAPEGPVYQAGTLAGGPLAVAAGIAMLEELHRRPGIYKELETRTQRLAEGLLEGARKAAVEVCLNRRGSMFTLFFTPGPVFDFDSASAADRERFACFFRAMLDRGVLLPPSQFEAAFVSAAHTDRDIEATVEAAREAFGLIKDSDK
ncbi:MAG: glutamate-1-semialdehyde-2,1-aminomutase [Acidobacteria bacterium RIFCSPLOWO2_12_FULL_60_22]|nr:MAG: glutamate-1-semialdehyde-2,1-aminomutase [Acidobacteria bacterium RIFCSPLOWO2_12_FULL_60_22]